MTPKVLFIGGHDKGAWQMRGVQMAQAMGAHYASRASSIDWDWPDVIVLVKRAAEVWWKEAAASGKPIVWDVLDFWRQPRDNGLQPADLLPTIRQIAKEAHASTLIGATKAMAKDLGGIYLPHHSRIGVTPTPPRKAARVIAYDGSPRYLGSWRRALEHACLSRRLTFVVNPPDLSQADAFVSVRGEEWDGPICRQWKSGVKHVNAMVAGRPILTQTASAFHEIQPCGVIIENADYLDIALDHLTSAWFRVKAYEHGQLHAFEYTLDAIVEQYRRILIDVARRAA